MANMPLAHHYSSSPTGGEDHIKDVLSFAMAPHTLKEGESVYHFELLHGRREVCSSMESSRIAVTGLG